MQKPSLKREIGPFGLIALAVSGIIGSGWLFAPMLSAQLAGPAAIVAWIVGSFSMLLLALTFAEISAMFPLPGGIASIPQVTHGNVVSIAMGWTAWLGYLLTAPVEVEATLRYLGRYAPFMFEGTSYESLSFSGSVATLVLMAIFVVLNAFGVKLFTAINNSVTWVKVIVPIDHRRHIYRIRLRAGQFHRRRRLCPRWRPRGSVGRVIRRRHPVYDRLPPRDRHGRRGAQSRPQRATVPDCRHADLPGHLFRIAGRLHRRAAALGPVRRLERTAFQPPGRTARVDRHRPRPVVACQPDERDGGHFALRFRSCRGRRQCAPGHGAHRVRLHAGGVRETVPVRGSVQCPAAQSGGRLGGGPFPRFHRACRRPQLAGGPVIHRRSGRRRGAAFACLGLPAPVQAAGGQGRRLRDLHPCDADCLLERLADHQGSRHRHAGRRGAVRHPRAHPGPG